MPRGAAAQQRPGNLEEDAKRELGGTAAAEQARRLVEVDVPQLAVTFDRDKIARYGLRMCDLFAPDLEEELTRQLTSLVAGKALVKAGVKTGDNVVVNPGPHLAAKASGGPIGTVPKRSPGRLPPPALRVPRRA